MSFALFLVLAFQFLATIASGTSLVARNNTSGFVSVNAGKFQLDGSLFRFYGTNAYWLQMTTDDDMDLTFHDIATAGLKVVRTWAFNDVSHKPSSGPYFQILDATSSTINDGADGLQRLDKLVATASKYGIKVLLSLTNNWNPERPEASSSWNRRDNNALPRGYLSNDYGGMDLYVRTFHPGGAHDLFYTDTTIIKAFKNYVAHVVSRYANNPAVLGWELGNDLRCASTVAASSSCNTATITKWVNDISGYIKSLDSHHLITAGDGGFYCLGCKKTYASKSTQPRPSLPGSSFDGSYGVDTEDILAVPCIDFGSFQLFPDQNNYFPTQVDSAAAKAIGDGGNWVAVHSNTATLLGKPEVLTAAGIVTKEHYSMFVPFNAVARLPDGTPCGGVETFQQDYAFTAWSSAALNGNVEGVLEYQWLQDGLTSHGTVHKRALTTSPQDGSGHYNGPANKQTAEQFGDSLPPIE
ncbi:glycoside hydrolase family 5 protein [Crepidotus variabilis]|uniref:mannan endo-1,4-beta-mannosidase n=1 Tax=Crepidotus variabilis TaxID=179855 RepID=A0A9P6EC28_9AGAR|nr:glycoside hydrolase family 5 protein [Crepidotus variabilis]